MLSKWVGIRIGEVAVLLVIIKSGWIIKVVIIVRIVLLVVIDVSWRQRVSAAVIIVECAVAIIIK